MEVQLLHLLWPLYSYQSASALVARARQSSNKPRTALASCRLWLPVPWLVCWCVPELANAGGTGNHQQEVSKGVQWRAQDAEADFQSQPPRKPHPFLMPRQPASVAAPDEDNKPPHAQQAPPLPPIHVNQAESIASASINDMQAGVAPLPRSRAAMWDDAAAMEPRFHSVLFRSSRPMWGPATLMPGWLPHSLDTLCMANLARDWTISGRWSV